MSITKTVKTGWGTDKDGNLFAPKTLVESIQNKEGKSLTDLLSEGGGSSFNEEIIAKKYDPLMSYAKNDYVLKDNKLYKKIVDEGGEVLVFKKENTFNKAGEIICKVGSVAYTKLTDDVAYGGYGTISDYPNTYFGPMLISKTLDGIKVNKDGVYTERYNKITVEGEEWYIGAPDLTAAQITEGREGANVGIVPRTSGAYGINSYNHIYNASTTWGSGEWNPDDWEEITVMSEVHQSGGTIIPTKEITTAEKITDATELKSLAMTNNEFYGEDGKYIASASSYHTSGSSRYGDAYKPFNGIDYDNRGEQDVWHPVNGQPQWLQLQLPLPTCITSFSLAGRESSQGGSGESPNQVTLQGSNNGTTFEDIHSFVFHNGNIQNLIVEEEFENDNYYTYYRWYENSVNSYGVINQIIIKEATVKEVAETKTVIDMDSYYDNSKTKIEAITMKDAIDYAIKNGGGTGLVINELTTSSNLNNLTSNELKVYHANGDISVANKPKDVDAFSLLVSGNDITGKYVQQLYGSDNIYIRKTKEKEFDPFINIAHEITATEWNGYQGQGKFYYKKENDDTEYGFLDCNIGSDAYGHMLYKGFAIYIPETKNLKFYTAGRSPFVEYINGAYKQWNNAAEGFNPRVTPIPLINPQINVDNVIGYYSTDFPIFNDGDVDGYTNYLLNNDWSSALNAEIYFAWDEWKSLFDSKETQKEDITYHIQTTSTGGNDAAIKVEKIIKNEVVKTENIVYNQVQTDFKIIDDIKVKYNNAWQIYTTNNGIYNNVKMSENIMLNTWTYTESKDFNIICTIEKESTAAAEDVSYDNSTSLLEANNLQSAVDELASKLNGISLILDDILGGTS